MKKRRYSSRYQFNLAMNEDEFNMLKRLKNEYSVNISGFFKRFLKEYLGQLDGVKK